MTIEVKVAKKWLNRGNFRQKKNIYLFFRFFLDIDSEKL